MDTYCFSFKFITVVCQSVGPVLVQLECKNANILSTSCISYIIAKECFFPSMKTDPEINRLISKKRKTNNINHIPWRSDHLLLDMWSLVSQRFLKEPGISGLLEDRILPRICELSLLDESFPITSVWNEIEYSHLYKIQSFILSVLMQNYLQAEISGKSLSEKAGGRSQWVAVLDTCSLGWTWDVTWLCKATGMSIHQLSKYLLSNCMCQASYFLLLLRALWVFRSFILRRKKYSLPF